MSSQGQSTSTQIFKRFQFFEVETMEEGKSGNKSSPVDRKRKQHHGGGLESTDESHLSLSHSYTSSPSSLYSLTSSPGFSLIHSVAYIMSVVTNYQNSSPEHFLYVFKDAAVIYSIKTHHFNWGVRATCEQQLFLATLGQDLVSEEGVKLGKANPSFVSPGAPDKRKPGLFIKIWNVEQLLNKKYFCLDDDEEFILEKGLTAPRTLVLDPKLSLKDVTALAITSDLTHIAVAIEGGNITLFRATHLAKCNEKQIKTKTLLPSDTLPTYSITNMGFHRLEELNKVVMYLLFCTSLDHFFMYKISPKKELYQNIAHDIGAEKKAFDINSKGEIIIASSKTNEVRKYYLNHQKNSYYIKGNNSELKIVGRNILVLSDMERNKQLYIYDMENELIIYSGAYANVFGMDIFENDLYLLAENNKKQKIIQKLKEKSNAEKLEVFIRRPFFDIAYKYAKNERYEPYVIADICKYHGDHLYTKGMYQEAIKQYTETIGFLNPSYVIQKYLDVQKLDNLITYLESLNASSQKADIDAEEHKNYTALLLNCYVKQEGSEKLQKFIANTSFESKMLDIETAIDVCKDSKNIDCAMELAKKTNHTDQYLRILIENKEDYCTALDLIHDQSDYSHKLGFLKMYGPVLLKNVPDYTYDMIKMLAQSIVIQKNQDSRSQVFHLRDLKALSEIFVDDKVNHRRFLEFLIKNDESAEKEVFHSLIELYLQDYYQYYQKHAQTIKKRITPDNVYLEMKDNLISFIREKKERFDKKHVLMLFQMYNFSQGIKELCQMLELKQELMTYYMQKKDYTNIMNICIEYGKKEDNLWIQALTYFITELESDQMCEKYIKEILMRIERYNWFSPLLVLEIASKNPSLPFHVLKQYLIGRVKDLQKSIDKNRKKVEKTSQDIDSMKNNVSNMKSKAQLFQMKDCAECGKKLDLPFIHFMCMHSYHDYCLPSDSSIKECPQCSIQNNTILERKTILLQQVDNNEQFFKELKEKEKKFDAVAKYFGRGLFSKEQTIYENYS